MTALTIDSPVGAERAADGSAAAPAPTADLVATSAPALPPVSASVGFGWLDLGVVVLVVALAAGYLYHRLWRRRGRCDGCARGDRPCAVERLHSGAERQPDGSVQVPLSRLRRR